MKSCTALLAAATVAAVYATETAELRVSFVVCSFDGNKMSA